MKTIFRYTNIGLLVAAIFATGAMATWAQDACADVAGQTALYDTFLAKFPTKTVEGRKSHIELGKQFLDKYGACDTTKENTTYFKENIPKWEAAVKKMEEQSVKDALVKKFDAANTAKNWDEVYSAGKEILQKYPEEFRTVEVVLASVGGEEGTKSNYKYMDDAIRYAKASVADLEAGKSFKVGDKEQIGLFAFSYPNKIDAVGWMNYYIGYLTYFGKKNKAESAPFLYKATQSGSTAATNPVSFELIGFYYFEELNKVVEQIQAKAKEQNTTDTPEVAQKKVDDIKALVAMSNGISERAMDAFSRAYTLGKDAPYKAKMKKNIADAYKVRYAKETGVDEWIAKAVAKPFINPTTPVTPISDPEPTTTTTGSTTTPPPTVTPAPATPIKPAATQVTPVKTAPAVKPVTAKPQATTAKPQATTVKKAAPKKK